MNKFTYVKDCLDGTIIVDGYPKWSDTMVSIDYYSDANCLIEVVPTAGTITVTASDTGAANAYADINDNVITCSDRGYSRPSSSAPITKLKFVKSSITGANYMRITVWKH